MGRPDVSAAAVAAASQASSNSPSATITAGPLSQPAPGSSVTVSCPPGTDTCQMPWSCPAAAAAAAAAATAPVPQDLVSPEPRSCTRISTLPGPVTRTSFDVAALGELRRVQLRRPRQVETGQRRVHEAGQVRVTHRDPYALAGQAAGAADHCPAGPEQP